MSEPNRIYPGLYQDNLKHEFNGEIKGLNKEKKGIVIDKNDGIDDDKPPQLNKQELIDETEIDRPTRAARDVCEFLSKAEKDDCQDIKKFVKTVCKEYKTNKMGQGDGKGKEGGRGFIAGACCLVVVIVIVVLAMLGVNIAKIVMGAIYLHDCPLERMVPIYLIVAGVMSFFTGGLGQLKPKQDEDGATEQKPIKERFNIVSLIGAIGALFSFAWLICGSVWIFGNYQDAIDGCGGSNDCCDMRLMRFAYGVTILDWVLIGLIIVIGIVACCFVCCCVACHAKKFSETEEGKV